MNAMDRSKKGKEFSFLQQKEDQAFLAWYIGQHCHRQILATLPLLLYDIEKLVHSSSFRYPHLEEVHLHLSLIFLELREHMKQEQQLVFNLVQKNKIPFEPAKRGGRMDAASSQLVKSLLEQEHSIVREGWRKISTLCHHYQVPLEDPVLQETYERLAACEKEIQDCLRLEDCLLDSLKTGEE